MDIKELKKKISQAIPWLAAEYEFLQELKADLVKLENDFQVGRKNETARDLKQGFRFGKYIGKSERKLNRYIEPIQASLNELVKQLPETRISREFYQLIEQIRLDSALLIKRESAYKGTWLLKIFSLYQGDLQRKLVELQASITSKNMSRAQQQIHQLMTIVKDTESWITSFIIYLKKLNSLIS